MITITQDLTENYPAYNDAFIKFSSSIGPDRCEIVPTDSVNFPLPFLIFPDPAGNFLFNLKDLARASFTNKEFSRNGYEPFTWGQSFQDNKVTVGITINAYSGATLDSLGKSYTFYKAVNQIGEPLLSNYLLTPSENGVDYTLNYWEGFPFDFQIKELTATDNITVKNLNTGATSPAMTAQLTGSYAVHVDKGSENWTSEAFLPIADLHNRIEIYQDGVFKSNLILKKRSECEGVYVRWFNEQGGRNYWLFDEFKRGEIRARSLGRVAKNTFLNAGSQDAPFLEYGKEASRGLRVRTNVGKDSLKTFETMLTSPNIEVYTSNSAFESGTWIPATLEGALIADNKRDTTEYALTFELPDLITMTR